MMDKHFGRAEHTRRAARPREEFEGGRAAQYTARDPSGGPISRPCPKRSVWRFGKVLSVKSIRKTWTRRAKRRVSAGILTVCPSDRLFARRTGRHEATPGGV